MTADRIEKRMLDRVKDEFDRREGSVIYDATAPASIEFAELYILADVILKQAFARTADREFLILRAAEFNIYPEPATQGEFEAQFNMDVPIGSRFNYNEYNFIVTEVLNADEHKYKMRCEQFGRSPNFVTGDITPIQGINGLTTAKILKNITPGEDEEETEVFRQRYFEALKSKAYGGNGADYKEKVLAIPGVGGVKVYRCWNGGGTVKLVVLNSDYGPADDELIKEVENVIDPMPKGKGYGLAPIGHTVTVVKAEPVPINYTIEVTMTQGHQVAEIKNAIETAIKERLINRCKEWAKQDEKQFTTVRSSIVTALTVELPNVLDVGHIQINGQDISKLELKDNQIPVMGTINLVAV
jgi:uncharacterized phage protein gp47/JayE